MIFWGWNHLECWDKVDLASSARSFELRSRNQDSINKSLSKKLVSKTYNSEDSLVVTHPTTNSPACGLSTAERTGSPVFHTLWSYVLGTMMNGVI
ncbi:hypothetical protein N7461_000124 [Penicillium sp. DV-2018c]|nr:hypothetical protein N7461_000124 [Penicillium sp. DV-2018c]